MSLKEELITCFQDTLQTINSNRILLTKTKEAIERTACVFHSQNRQKTQAFDTEISVVSDTTFSAAKKFVNRGNKVAVLNFASAVNPGGGVTIGALAQEECLCRSSNLLPCLKQKRLMKDYYMPHRIANNPMYSDRIIYSKDVTVFKTDDTVPVMMPQSDWFDVDVITCAAPNIRNLELVDEEALYNVFFNRIDAILDCAYSMGADSVVLGAFGCGAFGNSPELVSQAFKAVIDKDYLGVFENIVFAIKPSQNRNNFEAFKNTFAPQAPREKLTKEAFEERRSKNKYYGKRFSVMGDSISTLEGFIPYGYKPFYTRVETNVAEIHNPCDTWWGKVISFFGGELLVNDSFSGSRVTSDDNSFPSGISDKRVSDLAHGGVAPDVIIIYLGFNDWANGVDVNAKQLPDKQLSAYFDFAYFNMLIKIRKQYPDAEIWCCTLNPTAVSSMENFSFPYEKGGTHIEKYNEIIRNAAKAQGAKLLDLYNNRRPNDTIDGSHPNKDGMTVLAKSVCTSVLGHMFMNDCDEYFDYAAQLENIEPLRCDGSGHSFVKYCEMTGHTEYMCTGCGITVGISTLSAPDNDLKDYVGSTLDGDEITEKWFEKPEEKVEQVKTYEKEDAKEEKAEETKQEDEKPANEYLCPKCGTQLKPDDKFCLICGTKTGFEKQDDTDKKEHEKVPEIIDNRYELVRQVGKGASSVVYLAQDKKLDRICAVKIVNKNTYENKIAAQESLSEANKMKLLAHISIPQLYDIYDDEDRLCIVMEFIEGKTLLEIIKATQRPIDEYTIVQWSMQLCRVLFYLHTLRPPRIFRDLKPANIILQPTGVIKLIDFGTMKNFDDSRSEDTVNLGTKGYAAPEQFGGRGATDARTDIYGLGMTMYHMITGVNPSLPPFEYKPIRYYRQDISPELESIVTKCIAIEREERYQSAIHVLKDLERLR